MAGHRDDGSFAEDRAHHPYRKVGRSAQYRSAQYRDVHKDRMKNYGLSPFEARNDIDRQSKKYND